MHLLITGISKKEAADYVVKLGVINFSGVGVGRFGSIGLKIGAEVGLSRKKKIDFRSPGLSACTFIENGFKVSKYQHNHSYTEERSCSIFVKMYGCCHQAARTLELSSPKKSLQTCTVK